jgi:DNA-binding NarL/FixJ family response regulator
MSITVLLVDDHTIVRDGLRFTLTAQPDISVLGEASDGREALRQVQQLCPDIVVMDITMPGLNGFEATRQIHEACPSTQVIMLSVHRAPEHITQAFRAGARGYLSKQSAVDELIQAVRTVHAGMRYVSQEISGRLADHYLDQLETETRPGPLDSLSSRERQVLQLVAEGKTTADISDILLLSPKTVNTYRSRIMQKLEVDNLAGLVRFAIQHGLTPPE